VATGARVIACDTVVCGRFWSDPASGHRDVDYFEVVHNGGDMVVHLWWASTGSSGSLTAQIDVLDANPQCQTSLVYGTASGVSAPLSLTVTQLPPGTYWIRIAPTTSVIAPCQALDNPLYQLVVLCNGCAQEGSAKDYLDCLDPGSPIAVERVDAVLGTVYDLNPSLDTGTADWYGQQRCPPAVGGELPPEVRCVEAIESKIEQELKEACRALGYAGDCPPFAEMAGVLEEWSNQIAEAHAGTVEQVSSFGPVTPPGFQPCDSWSPGEGCWAFTGGDRIRDIVFVPGADIEALLERILGPPSGPATATWPVNAAAFYQGGYWHHRAKLMWADHIERFLRGKGYTNRFMIASWAPTQRVEIGAHAVLSQVATAMHDGTGVYTCSSNPDKSCFGANGLVFISTSTGSLVTDIALTAAATRPALNANVIATKAKVHIAFDGAFGGSQYATAILAAFGYLTVLPGGGTVHPWVCPIALAGLKAFYNNGAITYQGMMSQFQLLGCLTTLQALFNSCLVDLVPGVTRLVHGQRWINDMPVRTITIDGGHPSNFSPFKFTLQPGLDDGVVTTASQTANPNLSLFWPPRFIPGGFPFKRWALLFDPALPRARANRYFVEQTINMSPLSPVPLFPIYAASGANPYLTTWGMRTNVFSPGSGGPFDARNRYRNHNSFIESAADHVGGVIGFACGFDPGERYLSTPQSTDLLGDVLGPFVPVEPCPFPQSVWPPASGQFTLVDNREETLAMTGSWSFYYGPYGIDHSPLFRQQCPPSRHLVTTERGLRETFRIKLPFLPAIEFKRWRWRRLYDRLDGWQTSMAPDYVYELVLCKSCSCTCGDPCPYPPLLLAPDLNDDGFVDGLDLAILLGAWGTSGVADLSGDGLVDGTDLAILLDAWAPN